MSELDALKAQVGAEHGIGRKASRLLIAGETLEEVEASAEALSEFVNSRPPRPEPEPTDPITAALAVKAQQKRRLAALVTGRQPRDELGRFASASVPYDGGARVAAVPEPRDPEQEHGELVGELARVSRTFGVNDF
jgi:hypothetical protein